METSEGDGECCSVCLEALETRATSETSCKHRFHVECLDRWQLSREENGNVAVCPICRSSLRFIVCRPSWERVEEDTIYGVVGSTASFVSGSAETRWSGAVVGDSTLARRRRYLDCIWTYEGRHHRQSQDWRKRTSRALYRESVRRANHRRAGHDHLPSELEAEGTQTDDYFVDLQPYALPDVEDDSMTDPRPTELLPVDASAAAVEHRTFGYLADFAAANLVRHEEPAPYSTPKNRGERRAQAREAARRAKHT